MVVWDIYIEGFDMSDPRHPRGNWRVVRSRWRLRLKRSLGLPTLVKEKDGKRVVMSIPELILIKIKAGVGNGIKTFKEVITLSGCHASHR